MFLEDEIGHAGIERLDRVVMIQRARNKNERDFRALFPRERQGVKSLEAAAIARREDDIEVGARQLFAKSVFGIDTH